jgi:acetylornithine deacetylase/succinyl-diaminopimelate desuccinylase-like protein
MAGLETRRAKLYDGEPDNNQHSPNENIRVGSVLEGIAIVASVLSQPLRPFVTMQ